MKYLNKIIFINSANIPYAEISVDGNVHFTGTQGVGKSTVLRALLFFYNADKQRLGIQQGQKSFDEFYFRQSNSYILYEVMRDNGAYTILVSRYQGRASWRFIDAPYQRGWLIDDNKQVFGDWVKIREHIDKNISVSQCRKQNFLKNIAGMEYKVYPVYYPIGNGMMNIDKAIEDLNFIIKTNTKSQKDIEDFER